MMSDEKKLNEEQLENVTGGTDETANIADGSGTENESNPFGDVPYTPDKKIPSTDRVNMH